MSCCYELSMPMWPTQRKKILTRAWWHPLLDIRGKELEEILSRLPKFVVLFPKTLVPFVLFSQFRPKKWIILFVPIERGRGPQRETANKCCRSRSTEYCVIRFDDGPSVIRHHRWKRSKKNQEPGPGRICKKCNEQCVVGPINEQSREVAKERSKFIGNEKDSQEV